jgi:hypothetical protein
LYGTEPFREFKLFQSLSLPFFHKFVSHHGNKTRHHLSLVLFLPPPPMSGTAAALQPAMVKVNKQAVYLTADKKLNVRGTFGVNMLLCDAAGTVIPLDATGKTEFMLQEGSEYTAKPVVNGVTPKPQAPTVTPVKRFELRPASATPVRPRIAPMKWSAPSTSKAIFRGAARAAAHPYAQPVITVHRPPIRLASAVRGPIVVRAPVVTRHALVQPRQLPVHAFPRHTQPPVARAYQHKPAVTRPSLPQKPAPQFTTIASRAAPLNRPFFHPPLRGPAPAPKRGFMPVPTVRAPILRRGVSSLSTTSKPAIRGRK